MVINAASFADFEVFVLGLLAAEEKGKRFLCRTGPSFVRTRGGITEPKILRPEDLYRKRPKEGHGLVLVGSYVPTTTRQLEGVLALDGVRGVEMLVPRLLEPGSREDELRRVAEDVNGSLASSEVVVYTSRELVTAGGERWTFELRDWDCGLRRFGRRDEAGGPDAAALLRGGERRDHIQRHRH